MCDTLAKRNRAMRVRSVLYLVSVISFFAAPSVADAEGVVVRNHEPGPADEPLASGIELVEDLVIGGDDASQNYQLGRIVDIAVDARGMIYVLDGGFVCVQQFDSTGTYLRSFGDEGEGPGDFNFPVAIDIDDHGRIFVLDRSRITIFDRDAEFVTTFRHG